MRTFGLILSQKNLVVRRTTRPQILVVFTYLLVAEDARTLGCCYPAPSEYPLPGAYRTGNRPSATGQGHNGTTGTHHLHLLPHPPIHTTSLSLTGDPCRPPTKSSTNTINSEPMDGDEDFLSVTMDGSMFSHGIIECYYVVLFLFLSFICLSFCM